MELNPPFGDGVAVFVIDAIDLGELILVKGHVDVEVVVAVQEVRVVLGELTRVVEAIVHLQDITIEVHAAQERSIQRGKQSLVGRLVEELHVEARVDCLVGRDDVVLPAFQLLDGANLVPDAELVDVAVGQILADGGVARLDERLGLREVGNHADAVDVESQGVLILLPYQRQVVPDTLFKVGHQVVARRGLVASANLDDVAIGVVDLTHRLAALNEEAVAVAVLGIELEDGAIGVAASAVPGLYGPVTAAEDEPGGLGYDKALADLGQARQLQAGALEALAAGRILRAGAVVDFVLILEAVIIGVAELRIGSEALFLVVGEAIGVEVLVGIALASVACINTRDGAQAAEVLVLVVEAVAIGVEGRGQPGRVAVVGVVVEGLPPVRQLVLVEVVEALGLEGVLLDNPRAGALGDFLTVNGVSVGCLLGVDFDLVVRSLELIVGSLVGRHRSHGLEAVAEVLDVLARVVVAVVGEQVGRQTVHIDNLPDVGGDFGDGTGSSPNLRLVQQTSRHRVVAARDAVAAQDDADDVLGHEERHAVREALGSLDSVLDDGEVAHGVAT